MTDPPEQRRVPIAAATVATPSLDELVELLPLLLDDPGEVFSRLVERHGPLVRIAATGIPIHVVIVNQPDLVREVLVDAEHVFTKGRSLQTARVLLGDGLLTSEGDEHDRRRRMIAPVFHRPRLAVTAVQMASIAREHVGSWPVGAPVDVHSRLGALTLDIVGHTLFGLDLSRQAPTVRDALDVLLAQFATRSPLGQLFGEQPDAAADTALANALTQLHTLVDALVEERRATPTDRSDLLSMLVAARDDGDGSELSDQEVRDEVMTLLLAGHETTANALAWTAHLLSRHPAEADRAAAEVSRVLGDRPATAAHVDELTVTKAVLDEALRLYPPAWAFTREATVDTTISAEGGRVDIPAGAQVMVAPWLMHRDPRFWDDPAAFRPARWAEEGSRHRFTFFPFGGGGRSCIGEHFARLESMIVLSELLRELRIEPLADCVERDHSITLRPRGGLVVRLTRR